MITRTIVTLTVVGACIAGLFVWKRQQHPSLPKLPTMTAHCASGVAGMGLCSEWTVEDAAEKSLCTKAEGTWAEGACPSEASSAAGICVITKPTATGALHYASGWKGRAQQHCEKHGGTLYEK